MLGFLADSSALTLECQFYHTRDWQWQSQHRELEYTCSNAFVSNKCDSDKKNINYVSNHHLEGKTRNDVRMLMFDRQVNMSKAPDGLGKIFPNVIAIQLVTGLTEISSSVFKDFKNLQYIVICCQRLKKLDGDLLKYAPNLIGFSFQYNPITHIGSGLLYPKTLQTVFANGLLCQKEDVGNIDQLRFELVRNCPQPTRAMDLKERKIIDESEENVSDEVPDRRYSSSCKTKFEKMNEMRKFNLKNIKKVVKEVKSKGNLQLDKYIL